MVDLDKELFEHLRIPTSVNILAKEGFDTSLAFDLDVRSYADWTFRYVKDHGSPPPAAAIENEWDITDEPKPEMDVTYLLEALRNRKIRKSRIEIVEKLADEVDPEKFSALLLDEAYKLWKITSSQRHVLSLDDSEEMIAQFIQEARSAERGASYGFAALDHITGGAKKGHLSILAARPKRYKSWLA